ncbi:MAG: T9SS type A sorting domain-containing protein [Bacteroidota bacterium]
MPYTGGFEVTPYKLLNVYPNPTADVLNIELTGMTTTNNRLAVYDAQGKCVFEKVLSKPDTYQYTESISLADWPKGVYQVILQTENGNTISKVIRQ